MEDGDCSGNGVDVFWFEGESFTEPESTPVESGDERPVMDAGGGAVGAGVDEGPDFVLGEDLGRVGAALVG